MVVGLKWELAIDIVLCVVLLVVAYVWLHAIKLPCTWRWTFFYAAIVTGLCEALHYSTDHVEDMDAVHLEVLLPAFCLGCVTRSGHTSHIQSDKPKASLEKQESVLKERVALVDEEQVNSVVSSVFMVLVGLSMPSLFSSSSDDDGGGHRLLAGSTDGHDDHGDDGDDDGEALSAGWLVFHVIMVTLLMIVGKLFPTFCYAKEATLRTRFALSIGMCPRGEVGAGVIVISLAFGIEGQAITIAVRY